MSILFAVISGLIQGIAEFLPISSSGHLALYQYFFGGGATVSKDLYDQFDIILHLATLIAVFIVYYKDIFPLIPAFFRMMGKVFKGKFKLKNADPDERMVLMVIIATVPLVVAAFAGDVLEFVKESAVIMGCILLFNAVMLFVSDSLAKGGVNKDNVKPKNAIIVGLCQLCAILPGLSRSGSTITAALTQRFDREFAVKFSFIMSIPAIIGANIFNIGDILKTPIPSDAVTPIIIGAVVALVSGVASMKVLIYISRKSNFRMFSYYCFAIGLLAIILGAAGVKFA